MSRINSTAFFLAGLCVAGVLFPSDAANAQRMSEGSVAVTVNYEITLDRPDDETLLDEAMKRSREMVYSRVKLECVEMKRNFASSCELTQLDVTQSAKKSRREGRQGTMKIRANARFKVELNDSMKK